MMEYRKWQKGKLRPDAAAGFANPALAREFPLVFSSGTRTHYDFRSQHHGVSGLAEELPGPNVIMYRDDASARGIDEGAPVWVATPRGCQQFRARLTLDMVGGAIDAQMGGGGRSGPEAWQDCNVNDLTARERFDGRVLLRRHARRERPIREVCPVLFAVLLKHVGGVFQDSNDAPYVHARSGPGYSERDRARQEFEVGG